MITTRHIQVFHPSLEENHCFKKCCSKESTKPLSFEENLKTIEDNDVHLHFTNLQNNLQYSPTTNSMAINIVHSQSREPLHIFPIHEDRMENNLPNPSTQNNTYQLQIFKRSTQIQCKTIRFLKTMFVVQKNPHKTSKFSYPSKIPLGKGHALRNSLHS